MRERIAEVIACAKKTPGLTEAARKIVAEHLLDADVHFDILDTSQQSSETSSQPPVLVPENSFNSAGSSPEEPKPIITDELAEGFPSAIATAAQYTITSFFPQHVTKRNTAYSF